MKKCWNRTMMLAVAGLLCLLYAPCPVEAKTKDSREEMELLRQQVELLKQQNQQLNQRITEMEKTLEQRAATMPPQVEAQHQSMIEKEVARQIEEKGGGFKLGDYVRLSGLIEGDYILDKNFDGSNGSEFDLATLELYLDIMVNKWATGRIVVEYDSDEDKLRIDEGYVTLGNTEEFPLFASIGRLYMPFGSFETNMLQDPLTQFLGETNDEALVVGFNYKNFTGSVFAYNGMDKDDPDDDTINGYGVSLSYSYEEEDKAFNAGAAWISNIADSVEMQDVVRGNISAYYGVDAGPLSDEVPAMALYMNGKWGPWSAITEYVRALDSFKAWEFGYGEFIDETAEELGRVHGAKPAAWNLELAYTTAIKDIETVFALGYQRSWEAVALDDMPEHRYIGTISFVIFDGTTLSFEYYYDQDYSVSDGGTNENGHGFTTRLAYEF